MFLIFESILARNLLDVINLNLSLKLNRCELRDSLEYTDLQLCQTGLLFFERRNKVTDPGLSLP